MPSRSHNYESNGPEGRVRGNASQVYEKYLQLARDTQAGDRVLAESFLQHAEHYYRVLNESTDPNNRPYQQREARYEERAEDRDRDRDGDGDEDQVNGYNGEQQTLAPARPVSRFGDRRQDVRSPDTRAGDARSGDPRAAESRGDEPAPGAEASGTASAPESQPEEAIGEVASAKGAPAESEDRKAEAEEAKPVRRTRRAPVRRTTRGKSDAAAGGDEDAGLLKMLGEPAQPNGHAAPKVEAQDEVAPDTKAKAAEQPAEEGEAKPKPRRRRTTKASSEAPAKVDA